jgi:hypothetical protein
MLRRNNPHHTNVVRKYGPENILVSKLECSSEEVAFDLEKGLIKCLRKMGVKLTNVTDGGDGPSGFVRSAESNRLISEARKGVSWGKHSDAHKEMISALSKANWANPVVREKMTQSIRSRSAEISKWSKLSWTPERKQQHAANVSKRYDDPEFRAKASAIATEFQSGAEYRAKMRLTSKAIWSNEDRRNKQRDNMLGRVWMTNGVQCVRVGEDKVIDLLAQGWVKGRKILK